MGVQPNLYDSTQLRVLLKRQNFINAYRKETLKRGVGAGVLLDMVHSKGASKRWVKTARSGRLIKPHTLAAMVFGI